MDAKQRRKELARVYKERKMTGGAFVVANTATGKKLLLCEIDLQGSKNRFLFSQSTNSCIYSKLQEDWTQYGPESFTFTVLEELEKKDDQTAVEFREDLKVLGELWREKLEGEAFY